MGAKVSLWVLLENEMLYLKSDFAVSERCYNESVYISLYVCLCVSVCVFRVSGALELS